MCVCVCVCACVCVCVCVCVCINMQEVVKMTCGCIACKTSTTSGAQVNANRQ